MHDFTSKKLQNRQSQVEGEKKFDGGWGKKNMMGERRHEGQLLEGELDPNDVTPPQPPISVDAVTTIPPEFNPYVSPSPAPKSSMDYMKDTLGK
ncbi:hypothetical protein Bca52824_036150 [Brassica carinata]|uniref:Uncharacterized protein n=1 Tax=Brassica carinata TaxID=52824 RepID=A0A8X7S262_BRACI|nr:hypothetical protein Bca52824_036150 [Brassica carinata]